MVWFIFQNKEISACFFFFALIQKQMTDIVQEGPDSATVTEVPEDIHQTESSLQRYFQVKYIFKGKVVE